MHSKLDNILLCPTCRKSGLSRSEKHYICDSCKTEYPDHKGIATIIVPGDRREDYGKLLVMGDNCKRWKHEAKWDSQIEPLIPDGEGFFLDVAAAGKSGSNQKVTIILAWTITLILESVCSLMEQTFR
jgi:uncharacterized protein YbaR (Trm112 family)